MLFGQEKAAVRHRTPISIIKRTVNSNYSRTFSSYNQFIYHSWHCSRPNENFSWGTTLTFKAGDRSLFTNYRPVSILPSFSKFLEKVVYSRLYNYLSKLEILCDNPFDFSKNHSTSLAYIDLLYMTKSTLLVIPIYMGLMNMRVVFFLIVLRPFFDNVDHNILLGKLEHYGVRGVALDLAGSYLSNGLQIVQFNSQCSSPQTICCGVPQGST